MIDDMREYDHRKIEKKWQEYWKKEGIFKTSEDPKKSKCYVLDMFPYPSGEGLHVGHPKGYIATDVFSRFKRMSGFNILHPMGWDAFGLPAEQYAIKNKVHPRVAVNKNTATFKSQLEKIGFNYDWDREINTTDPEYYKWTQWTFLKMYEKGLAYQSHEPINWCPSCQTGLANEDLDGGACERCGTQVEKKPMRQWVLRITEYADRMLEDLDQLDWPHSIKESQRNWIGRSEGAEIDFAIEGADERVTVFTTRPDTLFGATYVVLGPEHPFLEKLQSKITNKDEVADYCKKALEKSDLDRTAENREKTGVILEGIKAINPATKESIPVFVADYVLGHVGTGAIMAVPAHDDRDFQFALKFKVPIRVVVSPTGESDFTIKENAYTEEGYLINSGKFDEMSSKEAREVITKFVHGRSRVTYKLRDWVFSRQRYWGEPIPIIHCEKCGVVPVPEKDLPVLLPDVISYAPTGTGESPLADIAEWVNTTCPTCKGAAKRETNTMPQWAGSSWYYLRYIDPHNTEALVDPKKEKYWSPVNMYVGGAEHATRHLIYARFWHKFLFDIGVVAYSEPFMRLQNVGLIMASDGRKMSKRYGNVINPDDIVATFGADALRIYEMFMGPFDQAIAWSTDNMVGARRFIEKLWRYQSKISETEIIAPETDTLLHQTIKKVGDDINQFKFNTAIAQMMIFANHLDALSQIPKEVYEKFILILAPFAPHVADEIWSNLGHNKSVYQESWPQYDPDKIISNNVTLAIQVNGKLRDTMDIKRGTDKKEIEEAVLARPSVEKWVEGKDIAKIIHVQDKIVNIVVKGG